MGGHAVRHYGIDRSTLDFDFHLALEPAAWATLASTLTSAPAIGVVRQGDSWRPDDFQRFVIGTLADGREERLEFWRRNHLLGPWTDLLGRQEQGGYGGANVAFLGLDDLTRSKETERDDVWRDVGLLEEIADERRLAAAVGGDGRVAAISALRSRRGFERAKANGLLTQADVLERAAAVVKHPLACGYLAPACPRS